MEACPEIAPIANTYDDWVQRAGYPCANHYIVTKYAGPESIAPGSLITVVKTGPHGRPFQLRDRVFLERLPGEDEKAFKVRSAATQNQLKPFFDEVVPPGTAIVMTLEANLLTQHAVPAVDQAGPSGSIVFRTVTERVSTEPARKKARKM